MAIISVRRPSRRSWIRSVFLESRNSKQLPKMIRTGNDSSPNHQFRRDLYQFGRLVKVSVFPSSDSHGLFPSILRDRKSIPQSSGANPSTFGVKRISQPEWERTSTWPHSFLALPDSGWWIVFTPHVDGLALNPMEID